MSALHPFVPAPTLPAAPMAQSCCTLASSLARPLTRSIACACAVPAASLPSPCLARPSLPATTPLHCSPSSFLTTIACTHAVSAVSLPSPCLARPSLPPPPPRIALLLFPPALFPSSL
ncbi:hypothetical protein Agub_g15089 [Astrephomene gubernaculifera]|uniref:Uncharacterized protein n=1 Tax=Astrephomene gubernaculifera TaxID=47775 RepID=A0AAD3HTG2_9CHLO|nr:hypothetical protein Agub_g15089 [Astrephomene gubernaculifera]